MTEAEAKCGAGLAGASAEADAGEARRPTVTTRPATAHSARRRTRGLTSPPRDGSSTMPTLGPRPDDATRRVDALLGLWFDPDRTDDDVQEATRRLFEAAVTSAEPLPEPKPQEA